MGRRDANRLADTGTQVEVRSRFDRRWAGGFEVVEPIETPRPGYRIRRRSDRAVLPVVFSADDVRVERGGVRW